MKRTIVTAILTAAVCFGAMAVSGYAHTNVHNYVAHQGDTVQFVGLDLFCDELAHAPLGGHD